MSQLLGVQNAALLLAPTVPPGMKLWLKPETLALNDGDAVSAWPDSSGQAHDAIQATALKQPIFQTNVLNGLPVVEFSDAGGLHTGLRTVDTVTWDVAHFTFFVVFHKLTGNDGWIFDCGTSVYNVGGFGFYSGNQDTTAVLGSGYSARSFTNGNWADDGVWRVITVRYNASHASHQFYVNGADQSLPNGGGTGAPSGSITQRFNVGSANNGGGPSLPGEIAEVLFYDSTLSDGDRSLVESYLLAKYAI